MASSPSEAAPTAIPARHRLHSAFHHPVTRQWHDAAPVSASDLVYPLFVSSDADAKQEIPALKGQCRWGVNRLAECLEPLVARGLSAVLIFGVFATEQEKDDEGSLALSDANPTIGALRHLRERFPSLLLMADVCLCAYTRHGHCGHLNSRGYLDNAASIQQIAQVAVAYAKAGAHVVAPSDMMDGRIHAIKAALRQEGLDGEVAVMSYAAKFASCFYGPFRQAAGSAPDKSSRAGEETAVRPPVPCAMKDRSSYQLPPASASLALRAVDRDVEEGADYVMVKPGMPYLDIIRQVSDRVDLPVAVYHVSGEYAMLHAAADIGAVDLREGVFESLTAFKRAGARILITYFTDRLLLDWL